MSIWCVVPAYNEDRVVADVVRELAAVYPNVVVVDDCSTDNTYRVLQDLPVCLLRHPVNLGQGASLQTGILFALEQNASVIVTFDSDGQHRVEDIRPLCEALANGADVALGSRFLGSTKGMPFLRGALIKAGVWFQWATSGVRLTDAHCGLRALSRDAAQKIHIRQNRMAHASELIDQLVQLKMRIAEVPVTIIYTEYSRSKGQSGMNSLTIAMKMLLNRFY